MNRTVNLLLTLVHFARARWRLHFLRGKRLRNFQQHRARLMVEFANAHSPFYRQQWAGRDRKRWPTLPTVDKRLMMENFDRFNTAGIGRDEAMSIALRAETSRDFSPTLRGFTVGLSSGTSGHRGLFLASPWEQAAWAGNILSRTLHDLRPRRLRVAFFLRSNSNLYEKIGGLLVQFRFFDLMMPLQEAVDKLNDLQPHIVVGPPSLLGFLAASQEQGDLRIAPERLVSVAEVLEPQDQHYLSTVFHAPVHQIYQCTEGLLAVSCKQGSLHIQEDLVVLQLEALQDQSSLSDGWSNTNQSAIRLRPSSSESAVRNSPIVTDLWRTTQPIIRYRLNDVLRMSAGACPCGSPFRVIESIEGRCDDILYFVRGRRTKDEGRKMVDEGRKSEDGSVGVRPFFPDTIRRMVLLASPDIEDYLAVQERDGQLQIYLALPAGADFDAVSAQLRASVDATIAQYCCQPADLCIENGLPSLAAGVKRRRVIRRSQREPGQ